MNGAMLIVWGVLMLALAGAQLAITFSDSKTDLSYTAQTAPSPGPNQWF